MTEMTEEQLSKIRSIGDAIGQELEATKQHGFLETNKQHLNRQQSAVTNRLGKMKRDGKLHGFYIAHVNDLEFRVEIVHTRGADVMNVTVKIERTEE